MCPGKFSLLRHDCDPLNNFDGLRRGMCHGFVKCLSKVCCNGEAKSADRVRCFPRIHLFRMCFCVHGCTGRRCRFHGLRLPLWVGAALAEGHESSAGNRHGRHSLQPWPNNDARTATGGSAVWSVQEGDEGGTIDSNGIYTAPGYPGVFHIVAFDSIDTRHYGIATVTVVD